MAESAVGDHSGYLITCDGRQESGEPCGRYIVVRPSAKTVCPHCNKVYPLGYLGVAAPLLVQK